MRKYALVMLLILVLMVAGVAFAQGPPDDDPTCDNPQQSGQDCAGDNGAPGCQGIEEAEDHTPDEAEPAMDLVNNILGDGPDGECEHRQD